MPTSHRVRVLVADDSSLVRHHLIALLSTQEGIEVVGEAADVHRTLLSVRRLRPQAVILDVQMPEGNGLLALRQIKREFPETQVIMLTNSPDAFYRQACLQAGASFFFDKSADFERVGDVLRAMRG